MSDSLIKHFPVSVKDLDGPVLVTGAGGCIGSWALALLARARVPTVAFDLSDNKRRPKLLLDERTLAEIPWQTGDIGDSDAVMSAVATHEIRAIIHLAALQVPFCKADPIAGARANVVGTANILEAARQHEITRVAYASSIAAHGMAEDSPYQATLYGAYKLCDEMIARVYFADWGVPSVGFRPGVVYGVARDQGLTSKTTVAILAAAAGTAYTVPFTGPVSYIHAGEAAAAFIKAISQPLDFAAVFDINGSASTVEDGLDILRSLAPDVDLGCDGAALPFPMDLSDAPLRAAIGDYGAVSMDEGIRQTFHRFQMLLDRGLIRADSIA